MNKSKDQIAQLPRIQSQKRVNTALSRKSSQNSLSNQPESNNRSLKRAVSSANTCKGYKYESTGAMYLKKIEDLEKQKALIENQTKKIQDEIDYSRKSSVRQKNEDEFIFSEKDSRVSSLTTNSKVSFRKPINVNDAKTLNNEIKISENKIKVMRQKIDEHVERNQKLRTQIDGTRKQIETFKTLNQGLLSSLQITNQAFNSIIQQSTTLDKEITDKNSLMHRTKVENLHKKAQIIKQYDNILKELDRELQNQKLGRNSKEVSVDGDDSRVFYVTEFNQQKQRINDFREEINQIEPKKKKSGVSMKTQINIVKERLEKYEKELEELKKHTGAKDAEEITKKFLSEYEENFKFYKYINELHNNLEDVQKANASLIQRRDEILQEMSNKEPSIKHEEILEIQTKLEKNQLQKNKEMKLASDYQEISKGLIHVVRQFYGKVWMKDGLNPEQLNQDNLKLYLEEMRQRMMDLDQNYGEEHEKNEEVGLPAGDLDEILENIKKENGSMHHSTINSEKMDKFMTREDFMKSREAVFRKKNTMTSNSKKSFLRK